MDQSQIPSWPFSCAGVPGVNLARALLRGGLDDLDGKDELFFPDERSKIAYRLLVRHSCTKPRVSTLMTSKDRQL